MYLVFVFLATILAVVLGNYAKPLLEELPGYDDCSGSCLENQAAYRTSLAFFVFFCTMAVATSSCGGCQSEEWVADFHYGWWCSKVGYTLVLFVACFLIPKPFFDGYEHFARLAAGAFIIYQILVLIDFAYCWNETWVGGGEEGDEGCTPWKWGLVGISLTLFLSAWTLVGFMFTWFTAAEECGLPIAIIVIALLATLGLTVASLTEQVEHGSLISSAVVTFTVIFTTFDALYNNPDSCNSLVDASSTTDTTRAIVGLFISAVAVTRSSYAAISNVHDYKDPPPAGERQVLKETSSGFVWFHILLALAMPYMGMLVTDWGAGDSGSEASMWVKIVTSWITIMLYAWTLIAPICLPERFGKDPSDLA